jgi:phosphate transport system permease protein
VNVVGGQPVSGGNFSTLPRVSAGTTSTAPSGPLGRIRERLPTVDSTGDLILYSLCGLAGIVVLVTLVGLVYKVINGASPAISHSGLGFLGHTAWAPNFDRYGAAVALFGTVVTSAIALVIAIPLSAGIAIYLALLAPRRVRAVVGPLVEMLAAIPSVILGLWGLIVLAPFIAKHVEPFLHDVFGFIPIFGAPQTTGVSTFTAGVVLSVMVLPIVASLSRDLFLTVPQELQDGAAALGATRWEVIRGVVIPTTSSGLAAAAVLGLGRALGEAIAVTEVAGDASAIHKSAFETGQTLASRIANDFLNIVSKQHRASLFYLAAILLVFSVATNLLAQTIATRFGASRVLTGAG